MVTWWGKWYGLFYLWLFVAFLKSGLPLMQGDGRIILLHTYHHPVGERWTAKMAPQKWLFWISDVYIFCCCSFERSIVHLFDLDLFTYIFLVHYVLPSFLLLLLLPFLSSYKYQGRGGYLLSGMFWWQRDRLGANNGINHRRCGANWRWWYCIYLKSMFKCWW